MFSIFGHQEINAKTTLRLCLTSIRMPTIKNTKKKMLTRILGKRNASTLLVEYKLAVVVSI